MEKNYPVELTHRIALIDGFDMGVSERTGTYVIDEEQLTIIETGPSPSVPFIKEGLQKLGHQLTDVAYIIVTHIHLDHAGGAGLLIQECPNAKLVVHPKGARHMMDPTRLAAGAKMVYGDRFSALFDPILPIAEDKILIKTEGDQLRIGPNRLFEFWDAPGHANHHLTIVDRENRNVFTGDTAGIHYEQLAKEGIDFHLPSTSPNQFDPDLMRQSILRIQKEGFARVFYGHFGMTEKPDLAFNQVLDWLAIFMEEAQAAAQADEDHAHLAARLKKRVSEQLVLLDVPDNHPVYPLVELDLMVSAMGLLEYMSKKKRT